MIKLYDMANNWKEIKFKRFNFSAGEVSVKIIPPITDKMEVLAFCTKPTSDDIVTLMMLEEAERKRKEKMLSYDAFVEKYKDQYDHFYIGPDYIEIEPFEDVYLNEERFPATVYKVINSMDPKVPSGCLVMIGSLYYINSRPICKVSDVQVIFPQKISENILEKEANLYSAALYK